MNKFVILASAAIAACATQASAEAEFGGLVGSYQKTTDAGIQYYTDVFLYVDGDIGRFFAKRDGAETIVGYSNSIGDGWFLLEQNVTNDVTKLVANYSFDQFKVGTELKTNDEWNVWGLYDAERYLVGLKYDHNDVVALKTGFRHDGFEAGVELKTNDEWWVGGRYAKDNYWVAAGLESDDDHKFEGGYRINENFELLASYQKDDGGATDKTRVGLAFKF